MVQHYGRWNEEVWASDGRFVDSGETTIRPSQLFRRQAQKHDDRCCPHRARYDRDSRSHTPCSQDTDAYLRATQRPMGRVQERTPSPQRFSENERFKISIYPRTWYLVPGTWYPVFECQVQLCTCLVFQGATFFRGQLLVRELSQRWVGIVSHLQ